MRRVRVMVDAALAGLLVTVMATALVQEAPHEYLGVAPFAAVVAHVVLNRRWFKTLIHGRYNAVRILRLMAIAGLVACAVGQMASALVLSKFAFGFLPALPGAAFARRVHMLCSYWGFVLAFAHVGLQSKGLFRLIRTRGANNAPGALRPAIWAGRFFFVAIACFGAYSFVKLDFGTYLLGQVQFALADYDATGALSLMRYASIAVLISGLFHYLRATLEALGKSRRRTSRAR